MKQLLDSDPNLLSIRVGSDNIVFPDAFGRERGAKVKHVWYIAWLRFISW